jgi:cysteine-rich repeat protein
VCGDGHVQGTEECDDGNADNGDACLTSCGRPVRWVSGDPHVHSHGCDSAGSSPRFLLDTLAARGLRVVSALVWGDGFNQDAPLFTGQDDPASEPGFIIHYDLEVSAFAAQTSGHLILLGLNSIDFSDDPRHSPVSGLPIVDWARGQGPRTLVGMAHAQFWPGDGSFPEPPVECCMPWEMVIHAVRGTLQFVETERRFTPAQPGGEPVDDNTMFLWTKLQNAGFRVPLVGASDFPCITQIFTTNTLRTDVVVAGDGPLTYEGWLDGIRHGRTAVGDGVLDRMHLRVEGVGLGGEVRTEAGRALNISLETDFRAPTEVQLLANGQGVGGARVEAGPRVTTVQLAFPASAWLIARTPHVLTSPVYIVVGGRPIRGAAADVCYLVRYVDHLSGLVSRQRLFLEGDEGMALAAYGEARAELVRRFQEAGGQACP